MGRRRKALSVEEQERSIQKGKMKEKAITVEDDDGGDEEESEDEDGLNNFEDDGFIVGLDEEEEEDNPQETQETKTKKKRKSSKCIVLDDDDLELLRENQILGINRDKLDNGMFKRLKKAGIDSEKRGHSSEFLRSLFDDNVEDEQHVSDNADDDMADFIVDDEVAYGEKDAIRQRKFSEPRHSSLQLNEVPSKSIESDECYKFETLALAEVNLAGKRNPLDNTDVPERMQIFEDMVGSIPADTRSIEEESSWILSQLDSNPLFIEKQEDGESWGLHTRIKREDIMRFLELNHAKKYDIPFIAMYRKEQCLSLLEDPEGAEAGSIENDIERKCQLKWHKVLWIIRELDKKWLLLQKRKNILMTSYNNRFHEGCQTTFSDEKSSFNQQLSGTITTMLKLVESDREIDDIELKFSLHFSPVEGFLDVSYKRPVKESYYSKCSMAGLWSLASKFGNTEKFRLLSTPEKVGMENHEDPEESPEELASAYKCATFETSESVLEGARHMAAMEISSEMSLRKYIRSIVMDHALLSTSPTVKGNMTIDTHHEVAGVKWLQDKPLTKFKDAQWLIIQNAEKEKLLEVKIRLPEHVLSELTNACNDVYLNRSERTSAQLWNEQRKSIVQDAILNFLLPSMEKEARELLTAKAKNWLIMDYGKELWNRVSVVPYLCRGNVTAREKGAASKVMACCWGTGKPGTTFVMLDSKGELVDAIHASSLTLRSQNINDQQRRKNDQQRLLKFLMNHKPQVIVIGANASCIRLRDDVNEIVSMMRGENHDDVSLEIKGLTTVLGDESLPRLYEDSEISEDQLPRQHGIVKRAVALGRYFLNPLAMVATLCGVKKEILSWKLNPLEQFLTTDEKLMIIEWVMADITNQVGVDVNLVISHNWLSAPLQFVSGLGPRSADVLCRELCGGTTPGNRKYLSKCGLNSMRIFWNAVGFLKVSCDEPILGDTVDNILDRTRVHPESYHLAEEFARAVYRHYNPESDATQLNAIEILQDEPKLLQDFDVNDYAARMAVETGEHVRETLYDIKEELLDGFKDPRIPYKEPSLDDEFLMMTRESGDVPFEGKRVQATVRNVQSKLAFCILDSGLAAVLLKEDFSDETDDIYLTDKLCDGDVLNCKIKFVDKTRCRVNLTCKASELKSDGEQSFHDMDPYYCEGKNLPSQLGEGKKEELENKHFKPRMICHPQFQNITADQAKEFLADKAIGHYIFHPSGSCLWKLTLTLKIFDGLCVHKDIVEGGKTLDMKSMLALGKTLKIGEEIFEDMDKVMERFVNPLVVNLKVILNHQKFKGSKAEVDKLLKLEKEEYPKRIVYGFAISFEHPGTFILCYIRSTNLHHEFIGIHPKGFKFRKQLFENIEQLLGYFQNHINDLPPRKPMVDGSLAKSLDGERRFNVFQNKHSIDDNGGEGRGQGRGRGRGRGRGFGCGRGRENSWGDGKHESEENNSSWGSAQNDHTTGGNGWSQSNSSGWAHNIDKSWGEQGPTGKGNVSEPTNDAEGNWGRGQGQGQGRGTWSGGGGWGSAGTETDNTNNDSAWANKGKGWNESVAGEGSDRRPTWQQSNYESEMNPTGNNPSDSVWGQGRGGDRGRGRGRRGRGDQGGCGRGRGREGNNDNYSGGRWSNTGNDNSGGGGTWNNDNSSGRGRGRGRRGRGGQGRGHEGGNNDSYNGGGWSSDWGSNKGKSWSESILGDGSGGGTTEFNHRNSQEHNDNSSGGGGGWGGWGGSNRGKSWGNDGVGEGNNNESGLNATGNNEAVSFGGGWGSNKGRSWGSDGEGNNSGGVGVVTKERVGVVMEKATTVVAVGVVAKERVGVVMEKATTVVAAGVVTKERVGVVMEKATTVVAAAAGVVTKERVGVVMQKAITIVVVWEEARDREEGENGAKVMAGEVEVMMKTKALVDNGPTLEPITLAVVTAVVGLILVVVVGLVVVLLVVEVLMVAIGAARKETRMEAGFDG
ncbi:transcription elongation factor SPT6 homolog isoform X2 [Neltuma alba]|uniref:transcription elongation factor SPT6 homolog isoform X2 n=1 Tax=Neltuma alba TaxID=207710 RepID=UPI0010A5456D|nr:transcription elongation factor SPT6 homolog isoform X2 [Prosopis alba]